MKTLYNKILKRLKKVVGRIIPHNSHFRPHSALIINSEDSASHSGRGVILHRIYPGCQTTLDIADDLYEACSSYWKPRRIVKTDYIITEVPNGRIYTDNESSVAIISKYNQIIDNVSLNLKDGKVTDVGFNNVFEQRYFTKPANFTGTVFSMLTGGAGLNNISHWFVDVLPRLHLLRESGLYDKVDWFLVPSLRYSFQTETLRLLGIPNEKIITGDAHPHLTADSIIASTAPRGNHTLVPTWLCEYIRGSFLNLADDKPEPGEQPTKVYISRSDSKLRHVENETELVKALEPYGFKSVVLSQLSICERIKLFSKASAVVSATGAGLVSILFCQPGTKVIELFNEGFVIEPYYDIATKINLDYRYLICKGSRKVENARQGQHDNLWVDIPSLVSILHKMEAHSKEMKTVGETGF
jgi:hypothetical protein